MTEDEYVPKGVLPDAPERFDPLMIVPARPVATKPVMSIAELDQNGIFQAANAIVRDRPTAQDISQSVYVRLLNLPPDKLESIGCLQAYAQVAARRLAINEVLGRNRRENKLESFQDPSLYRSDDPALLLSSYEEADRLLKQLPERQQELFILCRIYGFTAEEVASKVDSTTDAVQKAVQRALERLKRVVEGPPQGKSRIRHFFKRKEQP